MALSVYPRSIPTFIAHRNLLDDVNAEHINAIQREITAIASMLGVNPQIYNDLQVAAVETVANAGDEGGIDPDTSYTSALKYFNPEVRPVNHGSVSARLDNIERGKQNHCFKLKASGIDIAPSSTNFSNRPRGIRFPKPNNQNDPFSMYNGSGVTLRKSGFWSLTASIVTNLQGTGTQNEGVFQAAIDKDQTWLEGMHREEKAAGRQNLILNVTLQDFMPRGTRIMLRMSHDSAVTQRIRLARLSGFMIREDD